MTATTELEMYYNSTVVTNFLFNTTTTAAAPVTSQPTMLTRYIFETALGMPIALVGLFGNLLATVVLILQRPRLSTTVMLLGLAIADSLVLLTTILLRSLRYLAIYHKVLPSYISSYHFIFLALYPCVYFVRLFDMWLTVLLTIDRVIAVCKPLHASRMCTVSKAYRNMSLICAASFLFSLPRFFEYKYTPESFYRFTLTKLISNHGYTIGYRIIAFSLVMYIIPMTVLVVLNAVLLQTIRKAEIHREMLNKGVNRSNSRGITVIVIVVVSICVLCNSVAFLAHLLWSLHECMPSLSYLDTYRRYTSLCGNMLVTVNSAVNFIVYCLCSRNFRVMLIRTFRGRKRMLYRSANKESTMRSNGTVTSSLTIFRFSRKESRNIHDNVALRNKLSNV